MSEGGVQAPVRYFALGVVVIARRKYGAIRPQAEGVGGTGSNSYDIAPGVDVALPPTVVSR